MGDNLVRLLLVSVVSMVVLLIVLTRFSVQFEFGWLAQFFYSCLVWCIGWCPAITLALAIWASARWLTLQDRMLGLDEEVPVVLVCGGRFLVVCCVVRSLFAPENFASWVAICIEPYRNEEGETSRRTKKDRASLQNLPAARELLFPRILSGHFDSFVLEVDDGDFQVFSRSVATMQELKKSVRANTEYLLAAYRALRLGTPLREEHRLVEIRAENCEQASAQ